MMSTLTVRLATGPQRSDPPRTGPAGVPGAGHPRCKLAGFVAACPVPRR